MEQKKKKKKTLFLISGLFIIIVSLFFFLVKISSENSKKNAPYKIPPFEQPSEEEASKCPYLNENNPVIAKLRERERKHNYPNEDLEKLRQIPKQFVIKCYEKGYHLWDINQLWDWKLTDQEIPDLKTKQRIGVINELAVMFNWEDGSDYIGLTHDLVIIVRKIYSSGPILLRDLPMNQGSGNKMKKYLERIVNLLGSEQDVNALQQYEIFIFNPIGAERFGKEETIANGKIGGKSGGSSLYLALLSALYKKPISNQVASTGALLVSNKRKIRKINDQEIELLQGTNLPIRSLKEKSAACVKKGINRLVLSKYQSSPNLLSEFWPSKWKGSYTGDGKKIYSEDKWVLAEDYQQVVPPEIKEKIQVHFAENIKELRELFFAGKLS